MNTKSLPLFIFLASFFSSNCSYIEYLGQWPPQDSPHSTSPYYSNKGFETVYVVHPHGGGDSPLQKWNGHDWITINTKPSGVGFSQSLVYSSLEPGQTRKLRFPEKRLREMGKQVEGIYRFSFSI